MRKVFNRVFCRITEKIDKQEDVPVISIKKTKYHWISAAAIVLILSSIGFYGFLHHGKPGKQLISAVKPLTNDIEPGSNKATLTLAGGQVIVLNDISTGVVATQNQAAISKTAEGEIVYQSTETNSLIPVYNTINTPRGGEFKVVLPDGTKVWLNASSSLKFPTAFTGQERNVELTGEAYFEVAKNKSMPFHVLSNDTEIEVLGTHFNVMAYPDEAELKATLLEGSVKVTSKNQSEILVPGQQARIKDKITVIPAPEDAIAWKKGFVSFEDTGIEAIMRKVSRWYDVDVVYQGRITPRLFTGTIRKNLKLSELLKVLEANDIQFKTNGRVITVIH